jgi:hypothetical protein
MENYVELILCIDGIQCLSGFCMEKKSFNKLLYIRYEFLTTVNVKAMVFWDKIPFTLVECYQCFEGTYFLYY